MKIFHSVCIVTPDVRGLRQFYEAVLQIEGRGDDQFVEFPDAGLALTLYSSAGMEDMAPRSTQGAGSGSVVLEFKVIDVDAEFNRLARLGVTIIKPPTTQSWGLRSVWFRDPAGNIINFFASVPQ